MIKFFSILYNLIYAVFFGAFAVEIYSALSNAGSGVEIMLLLLLVWVVYMSLHSILNIFKKMRALSKGSVIGGAFAIRRDLPLLLTNISAAAMGVTDIPWSFETWAYVIMSVIGIIGIICTASVAKKYFR